MRHGLALLSVAVLTACYGTVQVSAPISGPRTTDADAFAKAYLDQMQARSFAANREFCGVFGRDEAGFVIATPPIRGKLDSCRPGFEPDGFNTFASYHSHAAYDEGADSEVPSSFDLVADREEGLIGYISTPGGRVWRSEGGRATLLCGPGCISVDPDFIPEQFGPVGTAYTADDLHHREVSLSHN